MGGMCNGKNTLTYQTSPRMKNRPEPPVRTYANKLERIVDSVERLNQQMVRTPLQHYLVTKVDEWFAQQPQPQTKKAAVIVGLELFERRLRQTKQKQFEFSELANVDELQGLLRRFQRDFNIADTLNNIVLEFAQLKDRQKFYVGNTIRKQQNSKNSKFDSDETSLPIYQKILCNCYTNFLQKELAGQNEDMNAFISNFHDKVGLTIFKFITYKKLSPEQLLMSIYHLLLITSCRVKPDDKPQQKINIIKQNLNRIQEEFQHMFIEQQHIYTLPAEQLNGIRYVTRSYIHDLYRKSLAEIDNPAIMDQQQPLKPLFIFPVEAVKSRGKKY